MTFTQEIAELNRQADAAREARLFIEGNLWAFRLEKESAEFARTMSAITFPEETYSVCGECGETDEHKENCSRK